MSQTIARQRRSTWLPPQPDAAAEFAVPEPAPEAREALGERTVWKSDGRTLSFAVFHTGEKRRCIGLNARELFACGLDTALVVGRPPTLERSDVARKVFGPGTDELHTRRLTRKMAQDIDCPRCSNRLTQPAGPFLSCRKRTSHLAQLQTRILEQTPIVRISAENIFNWTTVGNIEHYYAHSIAITRVAIFWKILCAKGCPLVHVDGRR